MLLLSVFVLGGAGGQSASGLGVVLFCGGMEASQLPGAVKGE